MPNVDAANNEVTVELDNETFVFSIPSLRQEAKIASQVQAMIVEDCGTVGVSEENLPINAIANYRTLATFETLLKKSNTTWPWKTENGKTTINPELPNKALQVYVKFAMELNAFFQDGATTKDAPSPTTVESK